VLLEIINLVFFFKINKVEKTLNHIYDLNQKEAKQGSAYHPHFPCRLVNVYLYCILKIIFLKNIILIHF
jgi:hypothetical protein